MARLTVRAGGLVLLLAVVPACTSSSPSPHRAAPVSVTALVGTGVAGSGGDGGQAVDAEVDRPSGLAVDRDGNVYVSDEAENLVRKVDRHGRISTVAGTGAAGFGGDGGPALQARLSGPAGLAVDRHGNLLIADADNGRIRLVAPDGRISTVAGNGQRGFGGDGDQAVATPLNAPSAVAVDARGRVFVADTGNSRVRVLDGGTISTVMGGGNVPPADGVAATDAGIGAPTAVAVDRSGNVAVAVPGADQIIRAGTDGRLRIVTAGVRDQPYGDTRPDHVRVVAPTGIASDGHGSLFVAEAGAARVRRVDAAGRVFTVVEGAAALVAPGAVAVDRAGDLLVADPGGHRVLAVRDGVAGRLDPRPSIDSLSPSTGGAGGATATVVSGRNFSRVGTTVTMGGRPAPVLGVVLGAEGDRLLVSSPPGRVGATVDVVVTTQSGQSKTSVATRFTYRDGWEPVAALAAARLQHVTALLDPPACHAAVPPAGYPCGQVLVVGGIQPPRSGDRFTDHQLQEFAGTLASTELYDPAGNAWRPRAPLPDGPRREASATLLADGTVLVAGGIGGVPGDLASTVRYDPATDGWTRVGDLAEPRFDHTATLLDGPQCAGSGRPTWCGRVLVTGGTEGGTISDFPIASAELYDPVTGHWTPAGRMSVARTEHTATLLADGRVLVIGGASPSEPGATTVVGAPSADIYDPGTNSWSATAPMRVARFDHSATRLRDGRVLVVGGATSAEPYRFNRSAEVFDPATGTWRPTSIPQDARGAHTATLLPDGRVLLAGGGPFLVEVMETTRPDALASAEVYDPTTDTWAPTRILDTARSRHTATLLDGPACRTAAPPAYCGAVLAVGGGGTAANPDPFAFSTPLASAELYRTFPR